MVKEVKLWVSRREIGDLPDLLPSNYDVTLPKVVCIQNMNIRPPFSSRAGLRDEKCSNLLPRVPRELIHDPNNAPILRSLHCRKVWFWNINTTMENRI